ncbi:GTPase [Nocardioides montaniterrae]
MKAELDALREAVELARGRLDDAVLDDAAAVLEQAGGRLELGALHTTVAIAGATGSGKSTLFNALAGLELSTASAQRPTTAVAKALVWSDADAGALLDWLEIPPAQRSRRAEVLPEDVSPHRLPDGLVLLDLPDHDSIKVQHHAEARRVVGLADVLIWVVDPLKYADAAIHREFLQPLAGHRDVTIILLNHIDTVPEADRQTLLRDVTNVISADGLREVRVMGVSARHGIGIDELRRMLKRRVEDRRSGAMRLAADVRTITARLLEAAGEAPSDVPEPWVADLERRTADAAGVPTVVSRAERLARERRTPLLWRPWSRTPDTRLRMGAIDRPAVDMAVRALVDNVCRDVAPGWSEPIRERASARLDAMNDRLDADLAALDLRDDGQAGLGGFRVGQVLALLLLVAGVAGTVALGAPVWALGLIGAGLVVAATTAVLGRRIVDQEARRRAARVEELARRTVRRVIDQYVVDPLRPELAEHARLRRTLERAARL